MIDRNQLMSVAEALASLSTVPAPTLGLDLDAPLESSPILWQIMTNHWPGRIFGFTTVEDDAQSLINRLNLRCDELIVAETAEAKAEAIYRSGVLAVISGDEQVLRRIPSDRVRLHLI